MNKPISGSVYLVSDLDTVIVSKTIPHTFVISLTEQRDYVQYLPEAMAGTIFLPPYDSMEELVNGNFQGFRGMYLDYLTCSEAVNMSLTVITTACLINGTNVIFYVPMEEMELGFFMVLSEYIMNCFGIIIGTPQGPFMYNTAFDASNLQRMYMHDFINLETLMIEYPAGALFDDSVVAKISNEMSLGIQMSKYDISKWVFDYKERIKQHNNKFLMRGVIIDASVRKRRLLECNKSE